MEEKATAECPKMMPPRHQKAASLEDWVRIFQSSSMTKFQQSLRYRHQSCQEVVVEEEEEQLIHSNGDENDMIDPNSNNYFPKNLLHLACRVGADPVMIRDLVAVLPHQLVERDDQGMIPLHYVCQRRSFSALNVLHCLLQAAPASILLRAATTPDVHPESSNNIHHHRHYEHGVLPSIVAHNASAPPTVVQYLLRRQMEEQKGLQLSHQADMIHLHWNEATFMEHVAVALQQSIIGNGSTNQETIHRIESICLEECRLSYTSWQLLQSALRHLLTKNAGTGGHSLKELRLVDLHIWQAHSHHRPNGSSNAFPNSTTTEDCDDVTFWRQMVEAHRVTLTRLELPRFYALTTEGIIDDVACNLARNEVPELEILDVRIPPHLPLGTCSNQETGQFNVEDLAQGVSSKNCRLKSLAIERLTPTELQVLLQGLQHNRSLVFFHIAEIVEDYTTTKKKYIPWMDLRQDLVRTLQRNTALERVLGPRPLIHCPQVQLYLQLNREYHRRDIGHWSPTLVAHVLAKVKEDILRMQQPKDDDDDYSHFYFPTHEPRLGDHHQDPRSTMFYILRSRPDILISKQ